MALLAVGEADALIGGANRGGLRGGGGQRALGPGREATPKES
jgi:hypothetical protein